MKISATKVKYSAAAAIMLAALLWSLDGVFIRPKLYALPAGLVVFLEHALGLLVLTPFVFKYWYKIKNLTAKDWVSVFWISLFGGLLGTLMITKAFFAALDGQATFATVVILQKLQPFFALFLAWLLLREKLPPKFYWWAALAVVATYFLAFGKSGFNFADLDLSNKAAWFSLLAAFAFGSSTVFGKRLVNHLNFEVATALRFGLTGILALLFVFLTGDLRLIGQVSAGQWQLFGIIVFSSGVVALFIYYFGLKKVSASTATICELFWPFSAVILDYLLNGNTLNAQQIAAALVLLVSFYFVTKEGGIKYRPFRATAKPGQGLGKKLGFATANLDNTALDIAHGIYAVEASFNNQRYQGLLHFGYRETFKLGPSTELYLKNFDGELYGVEIEVTILQKIREVKTFATVEELQSAVKEDMATLERISPKD